MSVGQAINRKRSGSIWQPLRIPLFRNLLLANLVSDIGTFMQNVGAAWLMVSFKVGPAYVALTQTAAALPFFLLAPIAGPVGDIVDRRKLVLSTELWMLIAAIAIAVLAIGHAMSPWVLLGLTFALSAGDAFEAPTWRAILPELVGKEELAPASALNGIEFNFARAVGPALAGLVIAVAGVSTAFVVNAISFLGVLAVIARWKRSAVARTGPRENLGGAIVAGLRYIRFSPQIKAVLVRQGASMFFASALLALLPSLAHSVSPSAIGYGILLGVFGVGAVLGAIALQPLRSLWPVEAVVSGGVAIVAAGMIAMGSVRSLAALLPIMLVTGAAWICFVSLTSAIMQTLTPDWVRARVLAMFLFVFQGSVAIGSAVFGAVAQRVGIHSALHWAGLGAAASIGLAFNFRIPNAAADLSPGIHARIPAFLEKTSAEDDSGPVLVTVEYTVLPARRAEFERLMKRYRLTRRRDGASRWEIFRDIQNGDRYFEMFLVPSWAEHLRQHERQTKSDEELDNQIRSCVTEEPTVHHLLYTG